MGVSAGDATGVRAGLGPDSGEAEGGVFDAFALGLWTCGGEDDSKDEGGEEDVREDFGP